MDLSCRRICIVQHYYRRAQATNAQESMSILFNFCWSKIPITLRSIWNKYQMSVLGICYETANIYTI